MLPAASTELDLPSSSATDQKDASVPDVRNPEEGIGSRIGSDQQTTLVSELNEVVDEPTVGMSTGEPLENAANSKDLPSLHGSSKVDDENTSHEISPEVSILSKPIQVMDCVLLPSRTELVEPDRQAESQGRSEEIHDETEIGTNTLSGPKPMIVTLDDRAAISSEGNLSELPRERINTIGKSLEDVDGRQINSYTVSSHLPNLSLRSSKRTAESSPISQTTNSVRHNNVDVSIPGKRRRTASIAVQKAELLSDVNERASTTRSLRSRNKMIKHSSPVKKLKISENFLHDFSSKNSQIICHQCRSRNTYAKVKCTNTKANGKACSFQYCHRCMTKYYPHLTFKRSGKFTCPRCIGICNCSKCRSMQFDQVDSIETRSQKVNPIQSEARKKVASKLIIARRIKQKTLDKTFKRGRGRPKKPNPRVHTWGRPKGSLNKRTLGHSKALNGGKIRKNMVSRIGVEAAEWIEQRFGNLDTGESEIKQPFKVFVGECLELPQAPEKVQYMDSAESVHQLVGTASTSNEAQSHPLVPNRLYVGDPSAFAKPIVSIADLDFEKLLKYSNGRKTEYSRFGRMLKRPIQLRKMGNIYTTAGSLRNLRTKSDESESAFWVSKARPISASSFQSSLFTDRDAPGEEDATYSAVPSSQNNKKAPH